MATVVVILCLVIYQHACRHTVCFRILLCVKGCVVRDEKKYSIKLRIYKPLMFQMFYNFLAFSPLCLLPAGQHYCLIMLHFYSFKVVGFYIASIRSWSEDIYLFISREANNE